MAPDKNNFSNFLSVSPNFLNQILVGIFLTLIFVVLRYPPPLSIFLGILGGLAVGWITSTSKTGPKGGAVASTEGVDAGLRYWLFFLLGFLFLGYKPTISILLGSLAGIGGGWIIAWWQSKEEARTQLPEEPIEEDGSAQPTYPVAKRRIRKPVRRYRRSPQNFNWFDFWRR
ncbi:MAG: hypothetical protein N2235_03685 [Fischerella sp.]|nr:hypothetical protein [Fischerella sp.]